jgi:DNA invertase Pin-like site-specific DNA recombinase
MNHEDKIIKYVAIYLRKSRGDDESALDKHKLVLTEFCKENEYKYVEYIEIGSGDSIEMRPVFTNLLEEIENGLYDGVCVMDIDRLGRGNQADQGKINQAFAMSNTYIITPQQVYNLNNDDDEFVVDMKGFISRREYKLIVSRLNKGKKIGSRQGYWTNGIPPYPYEYERYKDKSNLKGLVVNDEKLKTYRYIIDAVINENKTPKQIAIELNNKKIPSPRDGLWHGNTVYRLLLDETHLGSIIANKSKGDGHKKKKANAKPVQAISKDKWVVVHNCHESIKTQEEHELILMFAKRLTKSPKRTQNNIMPLSGIIKCRKCGHTMGVYRRKDRNMMDVLKPCWYTDLHGNKCSNSGMTLPFLYNFLQEDMISYLDRLKKQASDTSVKESKVSIENKINDINKDIENKNKTLERMLDGFENGIYSLDQYKERKVKNDALLERLNSEKELLEIQYNKYNTENIENKIKKIQYVVDNINSDNISDVDKNKMYKSVVDYIKWERINDDITIEIEYL